MRHAQLILCSALLLLALAPAAPLGAAVVPNKVVKPPVEIVTPQSAAPFAAVPVPVEVRFNAVVTAGSFKAVLNSVDVSSRFTVTADGATGFLTIRDGLRLSPSGNQLKILAKGAGQNYSAQQQFSVAAPPAVAPVSTTVTPKGGTVALSGVAELTFAPQSFTRDQDVEVSVVSQGDSDAAFQDSAFMFAAGLRTPYEIRVVTRDRPTKDVRVTAALPADFLAVVPADSEVLLFGRNLYRSEDEELDTFEVFDAGYVAGAQSITANIPSSLFTDGRRTDGRYEAILTLATMPTLPSALSGSAVFDGEPATAKPRLGSDACGGASLGAPLDGELIVTSPFGPRGGGIGSGDFHYGTDFRAASGASVKSMADGTIERIGFQISRSGKGWGYFVMVLHADGSHSLYAHLTRDSATLAQGGAVHRGDVIARSDATGTSQPHLHVEYAPNGQIFANKNKVDPFPCIGGQVTGSITVRDNGNLADDAFKVFINDLPVCQTEIGQANTCAVGALRPGTARLTLTVLVAPDDVGTYEISLADGLTFADGSTVKSGTLPQGGSADFSITVPEG
jgi:murein DD-endopeptidase MepM/ murein hydrolase activator NlpD